VAQAVEHLLSKLKALSSNHSHTKKQKQKTLLLQLKTQNKGERLGWKNSGTCALGRRGITQCREPKEVELWRLGGGCGT
jgi:hypothetical protein